jgi:hypothetical protein
MIAQFRCQFQARREGQHTSDRGAHANMASGLDERYGTFETCRAGLAMSIDYGRAEVMDGAPNRRY